MPVRAPDSLPKYIAEGLPKQDIETLQDTIEFCEQLIEEKTVEPDEIEAGDDEEIADVEETSDGTIVKKKVPCGKDCNGCPHGPYRYRVKRVNGDLKWDYLGKSEA